LLSHAQNTSQLDSLLKVLPTTKDTTKVNVLLKLAEHYRSADTTKFWQYYQEANLWANQLAMPAQQGDCEYTLAYFLHLIRGSHFEAIKKYQAAIAHYEKVKKRREYTYTYSFYNIAYIYRVMGNYVKAMEYSLKFVSFPYIQNSRVEFAIGHEMIGQVYYMQENYEESIQYIQKAIDILGDVNDEEGKSTKALFMNNLGNVYNSKGQHSKAMEYFEGSIQLYKELNDSLGMTYPIHNKGDTYLQMKEYEKAMPFFKTSMRIYGATGATADIAMDYIKVANCYLHLNNLSQAKWFADKALSFALHNEEMATVAECYAIDAQIDSVKGNYLEALRKYQKSVTLLDSIDSKDKSEQINRMKTIYDVDKKEAENLLLKKDAELQKKIIEQQDTVIIVGLIVLVIFLALAISLYKARQQTQKANLMLYSQQQLIEQQNEELRQNNEEVQAILELVSEQKNELQQQHQEITDSITYAQRIQQAILPFEQRLDIAFGKNNYFIFYQPRNVVSGDFYWLYEGSQEATQNHPIIFAVADCTGHGVPGAFMSMIGTQLLQEIVIMKETFSPDIILKQLQKEIIYALHQDTSKTYDGMDIAVVQIDKQQQKFSYAGAMNQMFYIQNQELYELKASRNMIGGIIQDEKQDFQLHTITYYVPTYLYLFSDGYQDQFGGEKDKKFSTKRMKEIFLQYHLLPMQEQEHHIATTIQQWMKKASAQTDDITVVGIRLLPNTINNN